MLAKLSYAGSSNGHVQPLKQMLPCQLGRPASVCMVSRVMGQWLSRTCTSFCHARVPFIPCSTDSWGARLSGSLDLGQGSSTDRFTKSDGLSFSVVKIRCGSRCSTSCVTCATHHTKENLQPTLPCQMCLCEIVRLVLASVRSVGTCAQCRQVCAYSCKLTYTWCILLLSAFVLFDPYSTQQGTSMCVCVCVRVPLFSEKYKQQLH